MLIAALKDTSKPLHNLQRQFALSGGHLVILLANPFFQMLIYLSILYFLPFWWATAVLLSPYILFPPFTSYATRTTSSTVCNFLWQRVLYQCCIRSLVRRVTKVKTEDYSRLDSSRDKILLCAFPHGVMPIEMYCALEESDHMDTDMDMDGSKDDVVIHTVAPVILNPILRLLLVGLRGGFEYASKAALKRTFSSKKRALLYPGGIRESLLFNAPDPVCREHSGFLRFAVAEGLTLVPIFLHNEEKIVGNLLPSLTEWMYQRTGVPLSFPFWRSRPNATIYYGNPVRGTDVDLLRVAFYQEFDRLRDVAGIGSGRSVERRIDNCSAASKTTTDIGAAKKEA